MQSAILDACVLYSAPLRDFLMRLAVTLYQPKWAVDIHNEWIESVLANRRDLTRAQLDRTRYLMDKNGGDCLVTNYEKLIPAIRLPDPEDRHVLAAAVVARASVIVTLNLSDFPARILSRYGVRAVHPDEFSLELYARDPSLFEECVRRHWLALNNPPKTADQYLLTLANCGLKKIGEQLRIRNRDIFRRE